MPQTPWSHRSPAKERLRHRIWTELQQQAAVHRDPFGHIPHFIGAEAAANRLTQLPCWQQAQVIKCNPDSPQQPLRLRALAEGKLLYMAVPNLSQADCFVALTAAALEAQGIPLAQGATLGGALEYGQNHGQLVGFAAMERIDLAIVGAVAVTPAGGRTGKGAGFADLELAMLQASGLLSPEMAIATTVHDLQLVEPGNLVLEAHDWPLDWIVTPQQAIETQTPHPRPRGLDWGKLQADQLQQIPVLAQWPRPISLG